MVYLLGLNASHNPQCSLIDATARFSRSPTLSRVWSRRAFFLRPFVLGLL